MLPNTDWNKNYILKKSLDFRGKSNEKSVFVCDLFDEFVPKNFKGDCELIPDATGAFEIKITADEILSDSDLDDNFIRIKKYWC